METNPLNIKLEEKHYTQFLHEMVMNLAGADGNNISFKNRLKQKSKLTPDEELALTTSVCLLTNARDKEDIVAKRATESLFVLMPYLQTEQCYEMALVELADIARCSNTLTMQLAPIVAEQISANISEFVALVTENPETPIDPMQVARLDCYSLIAAQLLDTKSTQEFAKIAVKTWAGYTMTKQHKKHIITPVTNAATLKQ